MAVVIRCSATGSGWQSRTCTANIVPFTQAQHATPCRIQIESTCRPDRQSDQIGRAFQNGDQTLLLAYDTGPFRTDLIRRWFNASSSAVRAATRCFKSLICCPEFRLDLLQLGNVLKHDDHGTALRDTDVVAIGDADRG